MTMDVRSAEKANVYLPSPFEGGRPISGLMGPSIPRMIGEGLRLFCTWTRARGKR